MFLWLKVCSAFSTFSFGGAAPAWRENEGGTVNLPGYGLSKSRLFQTAIRWLDGTSSLTSWYLRRHIWIILLWLCGIPLSTIGFLTILFWVYGVMD
jgi:hypothetical protein